VRFDAINPRRDSRRAKVLLEARHAQEHGRLAPLHLPCQPDNGSTKRPE
jgi:hypothetical protein